MWTHPELLDFLHVYLLLLQRDFSFFIDFAQQHSSLSLNVKECFEAKVSPVLQLQPISIRVSKFLPEVSNLIIFTRRQRHKLLKTCALPRARKKQLFLQELNLNLKRRYLVNLIVDLFLEVSVVQLDVSQVLSKLCSVIDSAGLFILNLFAFCELG